MSRYPEGVSSYGLFNPVGTVFQWTSSSLPDGRRIVKGCAWDDEPGLCRPAFRHARPPESRHILIGPDRPATPSFAVAWGRMDRAVSTQGGSPLSRRSDQQCGPLLTCPARENGISARRIHSLLISRLDTLLLMA